MRLYDSHIGACGHVVGEALRRRCNHPAVRFGLPLIPACRRELACKHDWRLCKWCALKDPALPRSFPSDKLTKGNVLAVEALGTTDRNGDSVMKEDISEDECA